ncbi:hypothetical protein [Bacteriovorax sp. Seq25_V]|uniref:hypothetical protein n=1 Tax=Bacteriovorax sp. Seq25_V TaxID=1201288 RepID=UPI00038A3385|nr:hypothetical protein [Bacteriovorax sp. Seq25_V]EQC44348.1 hypothetical protein M900_A0392 [Bacteriovorax sp. Seq25_V]
MHKFVLTLLIFLKMGLLCSPSVFAQSDIVDETYEELQAQSEEMVDAVKDLQKKYANPDAVKKNQIDPKQLEKTFALIQEQFRDKTIEDIEADILDQTKGSMLHELLKTFPKLLTFVATLMKDKEALPQASKILHDREKLKEAGLWMLGTFLLSFILKKLLIQSGQGILKRLGRYFLKSLILWGVRIGILVHFYGEYLNPIYKIFKKVFLS